MSVILYIRVPKAGSRSILAKMNFISSDFVNLPGWRGGNAWTTDLKIGSYKDVPPESRRRYKFSFSVVRNPWSRAISSWTHALRQKWFDGSFYDFFAQIQDMQLDRGWFSCPQYKFLLDENNELHLDFIGRLEDPKDWDYICDNIEKHTKNERLGSLEVLNKSREYKPRDFKLTSKDRKIIYQLYEKDIKLFDYDEP